MTHREVIKTLLNKQLPDRVGLNEHFWPHIVENSWGEQGMALQTDFIERFDLDLRSIDWFTAPGPRPDLEEIVEESDEWIVKKDAWGASFKTWKYKAGTPEHVDFSVTSPEVWRNTYREAFVAIDVRDHVDLDGLRERYKTSMEGDRFTTYSSLFVFEELRKILGDLSMLEALLLEPAWIDDFCSTMTRKYLDYFELLFSEVGLPDGMHVYDDLGYTAAPFASPQCHREMIHPHHKKLFAMFKDYGLPIILHTCGDFRLHLPCIVESGVDCIQAMEAKTGMDVVELAEEYKRDLCFMGNINIKVLETGDRDLIRKECLGKLNGMKELRAPYVYMSDHSIPPSIKLDDYKYMLELYRENCAY
jgi:uroporphyrinogen decarboxylase